MPDNDEIVQYVPMSQQWFTFPAITVWNRLDGRPRTKNFDRALKAEVRDALWILTKQWQMGEFKGDDAASPVFAEMHVDKTEMTKYQPSNHPVQAFEKDDRSVPLETKVENRPISLSRGTQIISLDIRLLLGRQWIKMLNGNTILKDYISNFKRAFSIELPDHKTKEAVEICAHPDVWQQFSAVAGRKMDGGRLLDYLTKSNIPPQYNDLPKGVELAELNQTKIDALNTLAKDFINWYKTLFYQPEKQEENAWLPDALEYKFACSAPYENAPEKVLVAEEYYQGRLDWYNFDVDNIKHLANPIQDASSSNGIQDKINKTVIPTPVEFNGMPNTRWWTFEDRRTNFGDIKPDTTDIAKLLLIEFGIIYANDWFLIPLTLPMGAVATIKGLAVTNVFGERLWIEAAGSRRGDNWNMFSLNYKDDTTQTSDKSLLMLPTASKILESKPIEEVMMIRDELANMVWGIEKRVHLAHGVSKLGSEAATETHQFYNKIAKLNPKPLPQSQFDNGAKISYEIMNSVPENWIPFIPSKIDNFPDNREIQLQRAAMPRIIEGMDVVKVRPLTTLLREGMETKTAYFIHEEEVHRAGIIVSQSFQRTRWRDGRVFTWLGAKKQIGRGEGNSGLKFDGIKEVKSPKPL